MPDEVITFGTTTPDYPTGQEQRPQPPTPSAGIEERRALLRKPFAKDEVELLPKYVGKKVNGKIPAEAYGYCKECGKRHPLPAIHLDYVGHAGITDRLNDVDPDWQWEPLAFDQFGLPLYDQNGGLWIRLTVLGVTRYGYGDAQGKTGPNAVKEIIGDAIRNAAMRFGVGTYLWSKSEKAERMKEMEEPPQDTVKQPPAQGPFTARCKACGHVHQFPDKANFDQWVAYWQQGGPENRCCPTPTLEVI